MPSEEEEALDLVRMLWNDLKVQISELQDLKWGGTTPRELDKRQKRSCCWALIVLLEDSSATLAEAVQNFCAALLRQETEGLRKEILKAFKTERRLMARSARQN